MGVLYNIGNDEYEPAELDKRAAQRPEIIEYKQVYNKILLRDFGEDYLNKLNHKLKRNKR